MWQHCLYFFLFFSADLVPWVLWTHWEAALKAGGSAEEQFNNIQTFSLTQGTVLAQTHDILIINCLTTPATFKVGLCSKFRAAFPLLNYMPDKIPSSGASVKGCSERHSCQFTTVQSLRSLPKVRNEDLQYFTFPSGHSLSQSQISMGL